MECDLLGWQPTLSCLENAVQLADSRRIGKEALTHTLLERHKRNERRITIDFDPTEEPTRGENQLALFNWL